MTATNPRTRTHYCRACLAGILALLAVVGCKSTKDGASATKSRDPLVAGPGATRIPPQNVPVPGRADIGARGTRSDPLLDRPVSKNGYTDDPERFKGTFVPGIGATPVGLAGNYKDDQLAIPVNEKDNRAELRPAGGFPPAAALPGSGVNSEVEGLYGELAKYGVKPADRTLTQGDDGKFTFFAWVPINGNGLKRSYTAVAPTAADAVKALIESVASDRK